MVTTLYRLIKYGLQGFLRNGWQSIPTLSVMSLALFVFLCLLIFNVLTQNALTLLRDKIDISVYFQINVKEDEILKLKQALESLAEVKSVDYVSRERALALFQERHKDDTTISQAINVLGENPLAASLDIKAKNPNDYPVISAYLNNENFKQLVDRATYNENQLVIVRLSSIVNTAQRTGLGLTAVLSIIAVLVTLNTIILNIYATREEIGVMRLVGASNKFIRGPYLVQGILYGVIGAVISLAIMAPLIGLVSPYAAVLMPEIGLRNYFYQNLLGLIGYQFLFGIVLGTVSSIIAVSRYLKI